MRNVLALRALASCLSEDRTAIDELRSMYSDKNIAVKGGGLYRIMRFAAGDATHVVEAEYLTTIDFEPRDTVGQRIADVRKANGDCDLMEWYADAAVNLYKIEKLTMCQLPPQPVAASRCDKCGNALLPTPGNPYGCSCSG